MAERALRQRREPLGQFDRRSVRAAREHRVFERIELRAQRFVDAGVGMAEQIDPPRADRIEIAVAGMIEEPGALPSCERDERHALVVLHLRTRMPYRTQTACDPVAIRFGLNAHVSFQSTLQISKTPIRLSF